MRLAAACRCVSVSTDPLDRIHVHLPDPITQPAYQGAAIQKVLTVRFDRWQKLPLHRLSFLHLTVLHTIQGLRMTSSGDARMIIFQFDVFRWPSLAGPPVFEPCFPAAAEFFPAAVPAEPVVQPACFSMPQRPEIGRCCFPAA